MEFLLKYWEWILLGILIADKIVAITPTKYDDMILTSIKSILNKLFPNKNIGK